MEKERRSKNEKNEIKMHNKLVNKFYGSHHFLIDFKDRLIAHIKNSVIESHHHTSNVISTHIFQSVID